MPAGLQVLKRKRAVDAATAEAFRGIPVANISDAMNRLAAGGSRLRPLHGGGAVLCGPVVTVKTRPGDNLMVHMALNLAVPGDVIVVDAGGDLTNSIIGERMLAYCVAKKFAGVIINGAVRDSAWIRAQSLPVYAAGISHRGPYKDGPGEINVPVAFDGMVIEPGDLVVGDDDGFVSIPLPILPPSWAWRRPSSRGRRRPLPPSARPTTTRRRIAASCLPWVAHSRIEGS